MAKKTSVIQVMITGDSRDLQQATRGGVSGFELLAGAAIAATKVLVSSATAIAGFSIREFAKFDEAMTKSTAIMGDLTDAMRKDMSEAARAVATSTSFSASEAADAFFFLASAGLDAEQSIGALPKVAAFAQAGMFDLSQATDLLTDAQSALGLTSDDTAENLANMVRVSDVLVKANTLANASVEEFSQALTERAGAAMRALGVDIETGTAALAVFADQGIKGSKAGTMLNTTLEGLTRTAREQADAYAAMGVAVFDADGEMRNMADIVGDLERSLDGMSTEAMLAELATLGLTRQARDGVIQLLGNSEALREYEAALRDAGGTADDVAQKQLQSFNAQLGLLTSGLADVGISIGEALAGPLGMFVSWFQTQIPAIKAFVEESIPQVEAFVNRSIAKFREFKDFYDENLAGPLGDLLGRLREIGGVALERIFDFGGVARESIMEFAQAIADGDMDAAGQELGQAINRIIKMAFDTTVEIRDTLREWSEQQDWGEIGRTVGGGAVGFGRGFLRGLFGAVNEETGKVEFDGRAVMRLMVAGMVMRIPFLRNMLAARTGLFAIPIAGRLLAFAARAALLFTAGLPTVFRFLGTAFVNAMRTQLAGTKVWAMLRKVFIGLQLLFTGQFKTLFQKLGPRILPFIKTLFTKLIPAFLKGFATVVGSIVAAIGGWPVAILIALVLAMAAITLLFQDQVTEFFTKTLPTWVKGAKDTVSTFFSNLWEGVKSRVGEWRDNVVGWFNDRIEALKNWFRNQKDRVAAFGSNLVEDIIEGVVKFFGFALRITNWFREQIDRVKGWFSDRKSEFENVGKSIVDDMRNGISSRADALRNSLVSAARNAWNATKDFLGISSPSKLFFDIGGDMMEGLAKGIDESARIVQSAVGANSAMAENEARRFADMAAAQRAASAASTSAPVNITIQGGISSSEDIAREVERVVTDSQRRLGGAELRRALGDS